MTTAGRTLFDPCAIGPVTVPNRLVMCPMGTRHAHAGLVTEADIAWHADRARGGAGLIITGGTFVHPTSSMRGHPGIEAWREEGVRMLRRRVDAVHAEGAKIFAQILHLGRETTEGQPELPQLAPSSVRSVRDPHLPHEMTRADVHEVIEGFVRSAELSVRAGYDGIEIHGAHGYLVAQFLGAATNLRADEFGGATARERTAFLTTILERVRQRCGPGVALGVRLSAIEETADGIGIEDTLEIVRELAERALVDYLSITRGVRNAYVKDNTSGYAVAAEQAAAVKAVTSLPVVVAGRITTPELAQRLLDDGVADLVGLGRALIADAEFPAKAAGTVPGAIRPCVGFVQDCRIAHGGAACAVNAAAGRESVFGIRVIRPPSDRRAVVVGGGPGGLEAARLLAERGCAVTLFEADDELGGQVRRAARGPLRGELTGFTAYLGSELRRLAVEVVTGHRASAQDVAARQPDLTVVATGAVHDPPSFGDSLPPGGSPRVLSVWELLDGSSRDLAGNALVADDGTGFWPTISAAELLIAQGLHVTLLTPAGAIGGAIPLESIAPLHARLRGAGTAYRPFTRIGGLTPGQVTLVDSVTGEVSRTSADLVVVLTQARPVTGLLQELQARGLTARAIGDCVAPRRITSAVLEANRVVDWFAGAGTPATRSGLAGVSP
ncbi:oxidoreductase [Acrocarpospora catenulata]|uniref:oxidoreductase n=1 Tax=Acrocarpospora catenulata TaxID=2836182 RepID=UPI001BD9E452|nr:NAD(P)-binding protein [Acrocarpospora catenulata]